MSEEVTTLTIRVRARVKVPFEVWCAKRRRKMTDVLESLMLAVSKGEIEPPPAIVTPVAKPSKPGPTRHPAAPRRRKG